MENKSNYVFDNIDDLINYIQLQQSNRHHLALQKKLYFLYAYYGATFGQLPNYPNELFKATFEPWGYGPVIKQVYLNAKNHQPLKLSKSPIKSSTDLTQFIDNLLEQMDHADLFGLINRSCADDSYRYAKENKTTIDNEALIKEYIQTINKNQ